MTRDRLDVTAAILHMQRQGRGSLINTASFVAIMGAATFPVDGGISAAYVTPL